MLLHTTTCSQLCQYNLKYSICAHHLANETETNCDERKLELSVSDEENNLLVVIEKLGQDGSNGLAVKLSKDEGWSLSTNKDLTGMQISNQAHFFVDLRLRTNNKRTKFVLVCHL